jgi:DnaJ-domain-containing protein 1
MRVFATSPDPTWTRSIESALRSNKVEEVVVSTDPRTIRPMLDAGPVDVVLVHEAFTTPTPVVLATALQKLFAPRRAVMVLVTTNVVEHTPGGIFDATLKWPVAPRVLVDRLRRLASARNTPRPPDDLRILHADIEVRCLHLAEQDHYAVLGVGPHAPLDAITAAYDRLSLTFHPDRVRVFQDADLTEKASGLFARICDAYRVLRNPGERARYDRTLRIAPPTHPTTARPRSTSPLALEDFSDTPAVQKVLRTAQRALSARDLPMALTQLRFALSLEPDNSLIAQRIEALERMTSSAP